MDPSRSASALIMPLLRTEGLTSKINAYLVFATQSLLGRMCHAWYMGAIVHLLSSSREWMSGSRFSIAFGVEWSSSGCTSRYQSDAAVISECGASYICAYRSNAVVFLNTFSIFTSCQLSKYYPYYTHSWGDVISQALLLVMLFIHGLKRTKGSDIIVHIWTIMSLWVVTGYIVQRITLPVFGVETAAHMLTTFDSVLWLWMTFGQKSRNWGRVHQIQ